MSNPTGHACSATGDTDDTATGGKPARQSSVKPGARRILVRIERWATADSRDPAWAWATPGEGSLPSWRESSLMHDWV